MKEYALEEGKTALGNWLRGQTRSSRAAKEARARAGCRVSLRLRGCIVAHNTEWLKVWADSPEADSASVRARGWILVFD